MEKYRGRVRITNGCRKEAQQRAGGECQDTREYRRSPRRPYRRPFRSCSAQHFINVLQCCNHDPKVCGQRLLHMVGERWNKVRVFDYYATDDFDYDNEKEAFDLCIDAYDSCIKAARLAIDLFDNKVTKQGTATDEMLLRCWGILCSLEELCIKVRTNRRYYGYYGHSSEQITNDGFFLSDEAKQLRRETVRKGHGKA